MRETLEQLEAIAGSYFSVVTPQCEPLVSYFGPDMAHLERIEVQRAIADHLATHGPKSWNTLRAQFPSIPATTFKRWIREVKSSPVPPDLIEQARDRLKNIPGATMQYQEGVVPLPAPVPVDYFAMGGATAARRLDVLSHIGTCFQDIELLRRSALSERGKVENPRVLGDAIRLRVQSVELWMELVREVWNAQRSQAFYDSIIEIVGGIEPDAAKQIMQRLYRFNQDRGFIGEPRV